MPGQLAPVGARERGLPRPSVGLLSGGELPMEAKVVVEEPGRQISARIEIRGRGIGGESEGHRRNEPRPSTSTVEAFPAASSWKVTMEIAPSPAPALPLKVL